MIQLLFCTPIDFINGPMAQQNREMIFTRLVRYFAAGGSIDAEEWGALTLDQQNMIIEAQQSVSANTMTQQARASSLVDRAIARAESEAAADAPFVADGDDVVTYSMHAPDPDPEEGD